MSRALREKRELRKSRPPRVRRVEPFGGGSVSFFSRKVSSSGSLSSKNLAKRERERGSQAFYRLPSSISFFPFLHSSPLLPQKCTAAPCPPPPGRRRGRRPLPLRRGQGERCRSWPWRRPHALRLQSRPSGEFIERVHSLSLSFRNRLLEALLRAFSLARGRYRGVVLPAAVRDSKKKARWWCFKTRLCCDSTWPMRAVAAAAKPLRISQTLFF